MSDLVQAEVPDSPPPPAYEVSEQEFDVKTAEVLQASQADHVPSHRRGASANSLTGVGIGPGSEQLSDTASLVSSSSSSYGAYGHSPYVQYRWNARADKEREAAEYVDKGRRLNVQNNVDSDANVSLSRSNTMLSYRETTPPPVFEAMGPSLDGPPYEGAYSYDNASSQITLTYTGGDSRPASPLTGTSPNYSSFSQAHHPLSQHIPQPQPRHRPPLPQPPQFHQPHIVTSPSPPHPHLAPTLFPPVPRSSPIPRSQPVRATPSPRPATVYNPPQSRVIFNPQVAYTRKLGFEPTEEQPTVRYDASSFYNAAVSSHVAPPALSPQRAQATASYVDFFLC
ncbi:hypothetical protein EIP91_006711 [Steccherinum ochraceum]|uniref:Uncharacterized protein n=1 Tax=Steccherinum ochraceum TaxID=92696 RepID=A0A4R0S126_9APHY|nr:hypothetical protein EIP91_006711 [Steccherinum ochraceum]